MYFYSTSFDLYSCSKRLSSFYFVCKSFVRSQMYLSSRYWLWYLICVYWYLYLCICMFRDRWVKYVLLWILAPCAIKKSPLHVIKVWMNGYITRNQCIHRCIYFCFPLMPIPAFKAFVVFVIWTTLVYVLVYVIFYRKISSEISENPRLLLSSW